MPCKGKIKNEYIVNVLRFSTKNPLFQVKEGIFFIIILYLIRIF